MYGSTARRIFLVSLDTRFATFASARIVRLRVIAPSRKKRDISRLDSPIARATASLSMITSSAFENSSRKRFESIVREANETAARETGHLPRGSTGRFPFVIQSARALPEYKTIYRRYKWNWSSSGDREGASFAAIFWRKPRRSWTSSVAARSLASNNCPGMPQKAREAFRASTALEQTRGPRPTIIIYFDFHPKLAPPEDKTPRVDISYEFFPSVDSSTEIVHLLRCKSSYR